MIYDYAFVKKPNFILIINCFSSILGCEDDVVFAHPLGMCHIIGLIGHLNHLSFLFNSGLDTSIIARKCDCAISTFYTTRIAGGFLFRVTPFFGTRKTPSHSTG